MASRKALRQHAKAENRANSTPRDKYADPDQNVWDFLDGLSEPSPSDGQNRTDNGALGPDGDDSGG